MDYFVKMLQLNTFNVIKSKNINFIHLKSWYSKQGVLVKAVILNSDQLNKFLFFDEFYLKNWSNLSILVR
jgi:hypothetical protein